MTEEERLDEVARILARGLIGAVRLARGRIARAEHPNRGETGLELASRSGITVAPRPAG